LRCIRRTLSEGDYQISGISDFSIERKGSLDEVAACCIGENRERFEREMRRLVPYRFKRLLIVGASCDDDILDYPYRSDIAPQAVLGTLYAWSARFDLPFVLVPSPEKAATMIERWAFYWCRERVKELNALRDGCQALELYPIPDER
jgi:ERCC4-type nuclease